MSEPQAVGGLFETCIGVPDLDAATRYWESFGFRSGPEGSLDADHSEALFGYKSALTSRRLLHTDSDHGLIRLMKWDQALNEGLGIRPFRGHGNRWAGQFVRSASDVSNHARVAEKAGQPIYDVAPTFIDLSAYNPDLFSGKAPVPFHDMIVAVREYSLVQPLSRQAFLERFNYESEMLGKYNEDCLFPATQIVHAGLMLTADDHGVFDFYDQVLGLKRVSDHPVTWDEAMASRGAFGLIEGETHWSVNFEEPRSGSGMNDRRSGRLLMFRFGSDSGLEDQSDLAKPGCLGHSLLTWRIRDLPSFKTDCAQGGCTDISDIRTDEFGVEAFTCTTPDRFTWTFLQA
ncbi:MAG: hypothetical protein HOO09_06955 [Rhodospirillaceae bacterium]|nr:hypothetical protein [Rhodospirillaceae bacterium]